MRLKRVKIFGFKTFAERAEFDIDGGVIAVVGPNGCGKSNLVDAILWGLGEGNARQLRAQTGVDVIFNGSSKRKPVGFAEVSLYFDNEDGSLPIASSEVVVSRKLARNGENHYSINRQACRLRDVLELLADSGLGRAGYAIVGQKEIDSALAASAEDRRAWVDEAAGVQRYRSRKIESMRRLSSAKDHLSRVHDILAEIETQREPLRDEAEVAKRYKAAVGALNEVESSLLIVEVVQAVKEVRELEVRIESATKLVEAESARANLLDEDAASIGLRISEIESDLDSLRVSQQSAITQVERAEAAVRLAQQKLVSFDELESSFGEEAVLAANRIVELEGEIERAEKEFEAEQIAFETVSNELAGAGKEADELRLKLEEAEQLLAEGRQLHSESLRKAAEAEQRRLRAVESVRELESAKKSLPDVERASQDAAEQWEAAKLELRTIEDAIACCRAELDAIHRLESEQSQSNRTLLAERASLEGRKRGIETTIELHEGLSHGAKEVLSAVERRELEGNFVPVGESIDVDKRYVLAIETALGSSVNDLITPSESEAKRAVEFLKQNRAGRATFQPISLMRAQRPSPELDRLSNEKGVLGIASSLVECATNHRPVIDSLLGRVLVVQDLDIALRLAKSSGWSRMVTLDGELVHHSGAVTGGRAQRGGYGLMQRRADLHEIEQQLRNLGSEIERFEESSSERRKTSANISHQLEALEESKAAAELTESEARRWSQSVADELASTQKAISKLIVEIDSMNSSPNDEGVTFDLVELEQKRDDVLRAFTRRAADAEQALQRIREAEWRKLSAHERLASAHNRRKVAIEADSTRGRKAEALGPERERAQIEIDQALDSKKRGESKRAETELALAAAAERKRELLEKSFALSEEAKAVRSTISATGMAAHQAEISRARFEARRANAIQRLVEEYGIDEEEALERDGQIELPEDAAQTVARLRKEIRSMGDVNVGAIEAFERLTTRAVELEQQRNDVLGGIAEVESSIRELDKLTRDRFLSTFSSVQTHFADLFERLFPGGEGKLELADPENLLESGIDIDVQLPGKKKQRLELLSGGERSLCATAFLFALLRSKPSPLVVLDEVDAPLDGRNVERFVQLLDDFSKEIQFIVITHNPTTIEAAPVWLGVTMCEPGVSTLVPTRVRVGPAPALLV